MSKQCPTCNQEVTDQPPTYPVSCPKCYCEYGPLTTHRPDSYICLQRQLELANKYKDSFNTLHEKYKAVEKQRADEQSRNSIELNKVFLDNQTQMASTIQNYENWIKSRSINLLTKRVTAWATRVLGTKLLESRWERTMRLVEEVLELAQAEGISGENAVDVVNYVYNRPPGVIEQEAGGVMVCMLAWAHAAKIDVERALSTEVDRIEAIDAEKVRTKQRMKIELKVGLEPDVQTG